MLHSSNSQVFAAFTNNDTENDRAPLRSPTEPGLDAARTGLALPGLCKGIQLSPSNPHPPK